MRIAVLTGLLACTLVFVGSSQTASASEAELIAVTPKSTESVSLKLVAVADKTESELLPFDTDVVAQQITQEPVVVEHVVQDDESLSDIAKKHNTTWKRIFDRNDSIEDPNIVKPGETIVIPGTDEQVEERDLPTVAQPVVATAAATTSPVSNNTRSVAAPTATVQPALAPVVARGSSAGNRYTAGNCTWYVKSMRPDLPNNLGNANTWAARAAAQGLATGSTPRVGAAAQMRGYMHVAYVTAVNGDGTVTISEMNWRGLYQVSSRTVPASSLVYIY